MIVMGKKMTMKDDEILAQAKKIKKQRIEEAEKLLDAPSTPPYFNLWAGNRFDMDQERNILLHFIESKGLSDECDAYIDKHFPKEDDE
jgi:hypothetical protein